MKKIIIGLVVISLVVVGGIISFLLVGSGDTNYKINTKSQIESSGGAVKYSLDEVAVHSSTNDCWMVIDGGVYNVTEYLPKHPGKILLLIVVVRTLLLIFITGLTENQIIRQRLWQYCRALKLVNLLVSDKLLLVKKIFGLGFVVGLFLGVIFFVVMGVYRNISTGTHLINPALKNKELPLKKYGILNLRNREVQGTDFVLGENVATYSAYFVQKFSFKSEGKLVSGLMHSPSNCSAKIKCPTIIQFRGYVSPEEYYSGAGTAKSAAEYAKNGFVSFAPDYLGYGDSDNPPNNVFEERFLKYTVGLDLIDVIKRVEFVDSERIGLWGHSNGGQVALTILEAIGEDLPTTLWAPVSAPFPYSILFYSDSDADYGKGLRKELSNFEQDYNVDEYTLVNYLDLITADLMLHQGGNDELVPVAWSRALVKKLNDLGKKINYYEYLYADHNMRPDWNVVVKRDVDFFTSSFGFTKDE